MVLWAAVWGGVLGLLWPGYETGFQMVAGVALGALAGWTLRRSVRTELRRLQGTPQAAAAPATRSRMEPIGPEEFQETHPLPPAPLPPITAPAVPTATLAPEPMAGALATARVAPEPSEAEATPAAAPRAPATPPPPDFASVLVAKARDWLFGGNTVVRMGVLVLFVGLAFLAKYAIDNALLPPELRLAAIAAAGIALFYFGFRLRGRSPDKLGYALTLQGAGVAVLYLTVFAAFRLYQFLPAGAAFAALGLVCAFSAVIALAQNAQAMAFIGFSGGFAAPILVSTGQGSHVGLFSYYLLLGVAIAAIAALKAWRALNLLGFFATFGVATAWGVLKYQPEHLATTEPFLIGFFLVYVAAALLYALRHSLAAQRAVDATLVFGVPIVAFSLQAALVRDIPYATAFSSLALGAFYLALAWSLLGRVRRGDQAGRWLSECFAALSLGFITLAVPLALDGRWTSAVWAVEGAAVWWMGRRQGRWLPRAAGLALQGFAAVSYLSSVRFDLAPPWPVANPVFIGALMLALSALALAWWSRTPAPAGESKIAQGFGKLEDTLSPVLFWVGFLWLQFALHGEILRTPMDANGHAIPVFSEGAQDHLRLLSWVLGAFAFHWLALPERAQPWRIAATPAWLVMPLMLIGAVDGATTLAHVFQAGGWAVWPLLLVLHVWMLRRLDGLAPQPWWPWVHAGGVWLVVLLAGNLLVFAIGKGQLWQTAWATVILLVAGTVVLLLLSHRAWFAPGQTRWPLDRFARAYLWLAAAPLALMVALGSLLVALLSRGNAAPLPYVPLLNPTDLAVAMGLAACGLWLMRLRGSALPVPAMAHRPAWLLVLAALGFIAINTVWLRVAHHWFDVPWDADRLFESFLVQAGYSILWTLLALGLMVGAHRRGLRPAWMLGAGLLGLTVLKLFVIDLSNRGGSERIFVFIAVGVLMLVVGYFAPLPPPRALARVAEQPREAAP